jgi:hypothetical protein
MLTKEEYEAKRTARYERLLAAAEKAEREGQSRRDHAHQMAECIPFGQPILVGHYSEGRDRNFRARIDNNFRKGYELAKQAEEYRSRAASIEANTSIFSDDPEAVEKLDSKLETLLARQAKYKAINSAHAKYLKNPASLDTCELSEAEKKLIRDWKPAYSFEVHPIQPYQLSNLSANIRTAKKRAEIVEKKQSIPDKDETIGAVKIEWRASENRIRIDFGKRVPLETYKLLKRHGYRATKEEGIFSAYYNYNAGEFVNELRTQ